MCQMIDEITFSKIDSSLDPTFTDKWYPNLAIGCRFFEYSVKTVYFLRSHTWYRADLDQAFEFLRLLLKGKQFLNTNGIKAKGKYHNVIMCLQNDSVKYFRK